MYDVIIIGAGAAGLFLAANIPHKRVLLLEKMESPGKKILITGSGMCNLTNTDETDTFLTHFGSRKQANFLKPALMNFSTASAQQWFTDRGLLLSIRHDGKVFPVTQKAQSVVDLLVDTARSNGTEIEYKQRIAEITHTDHTFTVRTHDAEYTSRSLVITTGGKSYETTGSDGSGYALAKALGHSIIEPTQALVGVHVQDYHLASLSGNSIRDSYVKFFRKGETKRYHQAQGDLLFTHKGVSGPVILNNSRFITSGDKLVISLIPTTNREHSRTELQKSLTSEPRKQVSTVLKTFGLFQKLAETVLREAGIPADLPCSELDKKRRKQLVSLLTAYPLEVSRKGYFSSAMATAGGVSLHEVNRSTMESRLIPGLFFAGEILDIDGDTGGYNLQAAWATAKLAADALK